MTKFVIAIAVMTTVLFADSTDVQVKPVASPVTPKVIEAPVSLTITPIVKSEFLMIQGLAEDARPVIIFGDNDLGIIVNKGDVEVAGAISIVDTANTESGYGVVVRKAYIKKGIGENFNITAGYKTLPFGHWTSNSVNFPLVRTGNYDPAYSGYVARTFAPQVEVGFDNGLIVADVAGYVGSSGNATSLAAKVGADFIVIAPNISVRADGMDTLDLAFGADIDLGVVGIYGSYSRGVNVDRMGSYVEVSVFPHDQIIAPIRADLLANPETKNGQSSFSLSTLYLVTDNVYTGIEYTIQSEVIDSDMQEPTHGLTAIIGFEF